MIDILVRILIKEVIKLIPCTDDCTAGRQMLRQVRFKMLVSATSDRVTNCAHGITDFGEDPVDDMEKLVVHVQPKDLFMGNAPLATMLRNTQV